MTDEPTGNVREFRADRSSLIVPFVGTITSSTKPTRSYERRAWMLLALASRYKSLWMGRRVAIVLRGCRLVPSNAESDSLALGGFVVRWFCAGIGRLQNGFGCLRWRSQAQ